MSFLLDNWYLILIALISGAMLFVPALSKGGFAAGISPTEAVRAINHEKAVVLDVRESKEFAQSHIKGSKNIPVAELNAAQAERTLKNKATPVVIVCNTGVQAQRALKTLKGLGYEKAQVLAGGLKAWRDANMPIATGGK